MILQNRETIKMDIFLSKPQSKTLRYVKSQALVNLENLITNFKIRQLYLI